MTRPRRQAPWLRAARVLGLWLGPVALAALLLKHPQEELPRVAVDAVCYLTVFGLFGSLGPIRRYFTGLPRPHQCVLGAMALLLLVGQLVDRPRLTFPFTSWAMYGAPEHPRTLVFYRYQGLDVQGEPVPIAAEALFRAVGPSGFASKVKLLAKRAWSGDDLLTQERARQRLTALLHAVGARYNIEHPERPVHTVVLLRASLELQRPASGVTEEPIWRAEVLD